MGEGCYNSRECDISWKAGEVLRFPQKNNKIPAHNLGMCVSAPLPPTKTSTILQCEQSWGGHQGYRLVPPWTSIFLTLSCSLLALPDDLRLRYGHEAASTCGYSRSGAGSSAPALLQRECSVLRPRSSLPGSRSSGADLPSLEESPDIQTEAWDVLDTLFNHGETSTRLLPSESRYFPRQTAFLHESTSPPPQYGLGLGSRSLWACRANIPLLCYLPSPL